MRLCSSLQWLGSTSKLLVIAYGCWLHYSVWWSLFDDFTSVFEMIMIAITVQEICIICKSIFIVHISTACNEKAIKYSQLTFVRVKRCIEFYINLLSLQWHALYKGLWSNVIFKTHNSKFLSIKHFWEVFCQLNNVIKQSIEHTYIPLSLISLFHSMAL